MRYCIDIDGTICSQNDDYNKAEPFTDIIAKINRLYDEGHYIMFFTARGTMSGIDWKDTTVKQLEAWGVKCHKIIFGKPEADYYIDDKGVCADDFSNSTS